jgi:hypothetical protein
MIESDKKAKDLKTFPHTCTRVEVCFQEMAED